MISISLLYTYLHNMPERERRLDLSHLLSLFTPKELAEVEDALAEAKGRLSPLKVSLKI